MIAPVGVRCDFPSHAYNMTMGVSPREEEEEGPWTSTTHRILPN